MTIIQSWLASLAVFGVIFLVGLWFKASEKRQAEKAKQEETDRLTNIAEQSIVTSEPLTIRDTTTSSGESDFVDLRSSERVLATSVRMLTRELARTRRILVEQFESQRRSATR